MTGSVSSKTYTAPMPQGSSSQGANDALMDQLSNPTLYKNPAAVAALLSEVAGIVSQKEQENNSKLAQMRSQASVAQVQATQVQGEALMASSISQAVGSGMSGGAEALNASHFGSNLDEQNKLHEAHGSKLNQIDEKIKGMTAPDAATGVATKPEDVTKLKVEREMASKKYETELGHVSNTQAQRAKMISAGGTMANALMGIGSSAAQAQKATADSTSTLEGQVIQDIKGNQDTASQVMNQAAQLLTATGDLAKASVGR